MNILLISPYRTTSGWGEGSKHLVKALNTLNHNLAIRPIYMSNEIDTTFDDPELLELEKAQYDHYDIVIQRVLPHIFDRVPNAINILACVFETVNIHTTHWWQYLKMADAVIVPSEYEQTSIDGCFRNDAPPTYNVSEAIDITKYDQEYNIIPEFQNTFNFYFIGEFIERKNIKALLIAFHREFRKNEPVNLVIKTSGDPQYIEQEIVKIKQNLRIYQDLTKYKTDILLRSRLTDTQIHDLHKNCHCLVMPSCGEAYCRPVVDALGYGNTPIVTDNTGMTDYINNENGWVVDSRIEPVYTTQAPLPEIYTAKENWANIDILHLMKCMRQAYELYQNKKLPQKNRTDMQQFSYSNIGQNIQRVIDAITN